MEYEVGTKLDRIEQKIDLLMQKIYPEAFKESPEEKSGEEGSTKKK